MCATPLHILYLYHLLHSSFWFHKHLVFVHQHTSFINFSCQSCLMFEVRKTIMIIKWFYNEGHHSITERSKHNRKLGWGFFKGGAQATWKPTFHFYAYVPDYYNNNSFITCHTCHLDTIGPSCFSQMIFNNIVSRYMCMFTCLEEKEGRFTCSMPHQMTEMLLLT